MKRLKLRVNAAITRVCRVAILRTRPTVILRAAAGSLILLAAASASAATLTPINDVQLASVTGQEGVALNFDYGMNAFKEDTTIGSTTYKRGDPLTRALLEDNPSLSDPAATIYGWNGCARIGASTPNACSLAVATNNRPGMWVILKDMWAVLKMHDFWIDGGRVSESGGDYSLSLPGSKTYTSSFALSNDNADPTRFYDEAGNCLLAGKSAGAGCNMSGLPALVMHYDPLNAANNKPDVTWHLHIGRVAIQGDASDGTPAYMLDQQGSFMSYQVTDFNQNEAKIHYGGRVLMFGF